MIGKKRLAIDLNHAIWSQLDFGNGLRFVGG